MKNRPDTRYIVLLALYSEYIREDGNLRRIGSRTLEMDADNFGWSLMRLQDEELIGGCTFQPEHPQSAAELRGVLRDRLYFTPAGLRKCCELLSADAGASDLEKRHLLMDFFAKLGATVICELIARAL